MTESVLDFAKPAEQKPVKVTPSFNVLDFAKPAAPISLPTLTPAVQAAAQVPTAPSVLDFAKPVKEEGSGTYGQQFRAGVVGTKESFGGALQLAGNLFNSEGLTKYGQEVEQTADQELATLPDPGKLEDALKKSPAAVFDWATKSMVRAAPLTGGALVTGAAAATVGVPAAATATVTGLTFGLLAAGDNYLEFRKQGLDAPKAALASGLAVGVLDALPMTHLLARGQKIIGVGAVGKGFKEFAKTIGKTAGKQALEEGITEGLQEGITLSTRGVLGIPADSNEILSRLINSSAAGFVMGGVSGSAVSSASYALGRIPKVQPFQDLAETAVSEGASAEPDETALSASSSTEVVSATRAKLTKLSIPKLVIDLVDTVKAVTPEQVLIDPVVREKASAYLDSLELRGVSTEKQQRLFAKHWKQEGNPAAYAGTFETLRKETRPAREDVIVTYPNPSIAKRMDAEARAALRTFDWDGTTELPSPILPRRRQIPLRPIVTEDNALQMTSDELYKAADQATEYEKNLETLLFGDRVKEYRTARRQANSAIDATASKGQAIVDELEGALTEAEQNALFARGHTGLVDEQLRDIAKEAVNFDLEGLARETTDNLMQDFAQTARGFSMTNEFDVAGRIGKTRALQGLSEELIKRGKTQEDFGNIFGSYVESVGGNVAGAKELLRSAMESAHKPRASTPITQQLIEAPRATKAVRAAVTKVKVFVTNAVISTPVTHYTDGRYLLAVTDIKDFRKALGGVVMQEAIRRLPQESQERIQKLFMASAEPSFQEGLAAGPLEGKTWAKWLADNVQTNPELLDVHNALSDYYNTRKPTATYEEFLQYLGQRAALPAPVESVKAYIQEMQKRIQPEGTNAWTIDAALDISNLTNEDLKNHNAVRELAKGAVDKQTAAELDLASLQTSSFKRNWLTFLQLAEENKQVRAVQDYKKIVDLGQELKNNWLFKSNERVRQILSIGRGQQSRLFLALTEGTLESTKLERALTPDELTAFLKKHGVKGPGQELAPLILQDFQDYLDQAERAQLEQASRLPAPATRSEVMKEIQEEFARLRNRTYFPLTRFGKFVVSQHYAKDVMVEGVLREKGEVVFFRQYETEKEARQVRVEMLKEDKAGIYATGLGELTEAEASLIQFPPTMIDVLATEAGLDAGQIAKLRQYVYKYAPGRSFVKHYIKRQGVAGFSTDGLRAYQDYFTSGSNHLLRVKYGDLMANSINEVKALAKETNLAGGDSVGLAELHKYLTKHRVDMMNPNMDYATIKHGIFIWIFGLNFKQPLVNLTQVGLVTYPRMAAEYGRGAAVKAFGIAAKKYIQHFSDPSIYTASDNAVMERLTKSGTLGESHAAEAAGIASGDLFSQSTSFVGRAAFRLAKASTTPFKLTEMLNRYYTALTVLELTKELPDEVRYERARDMIRNTHGEVAKWNRPQIVRGGLPSVMYSMKSFTQMMLYHFAKAPGGRESLLYTLALGGVLGLPFAKDVTDVGDLVLSMLKKFGYWKGRPDTEEKMLEFLKDASLNYDQVLHGLSRQIPIGKYDLDASGSLGFGQIIPGVREIADATRSAIGEPSGRDAMQTAATAGADVFGVGGSIMLNIYRGLTSKNPSTVAKMVNVAPNAVRSAVRALEAGYSGEYKDAAGNKLDKVDLTDPGGAVELAAYGLGFTPTRLATARELSWAQREVASYWLARKDMIMNQLAEAVANKNDEDRKIAVQAIRNFNAEPPPVGYRFSSEDVSSGLKIRLKNKALRERGLPPTRRQVPEARRQAQLRNLRPPGAPPVVPKPLQE